MEGVVVAMLSSTAIALVTLMAFSAGMTGSPLPRVPPATYLAVVAAVGGLAPAATAIPPPPY